jgi:D-alanyl-D-alanine carboxypeptidase
MMLSIDDGAHPPWHGASGFADLTSKVPLAPCGLTRVGSTVKTFTAAAVLLLAEEGKFSLEDPIANYLPASRLQRLENAQTATIRQLLQHSSGIYNYISNLRFQTDSLNDLTRVWQPEELLAYARGKSAEFPVGTDVSYTNTNYVLRGDLLVVVEGEPFWRTFEKRLFEPLALSMTQFAAEDPVPSRLTRGYVDLYSTGDVIESTYFSGWDYFSADGGLLSNPHDLQHFLRELASGNLLSPESWKAMTRFQAPQDRDPAGFLTSYGLGLFQIETQHGPAYIHSGDAIGYFASMVHFPQQDITISWAVNGNYGTLDDVAQSKEAMEFMFDVILAK